MKAIYGLKKALQVWNETFDALYYPSGSKYSPLTHVFKSTRSIITACWYWIRFYEGDMLVTSSSPGLITKTKNDLKTRFEMTGSGRRSNALGVKLENDTDGSFAICQRRYVNDFLKSFTMDECKAATISVALICYLT